MSTIYVAKSGFDTATGGFSDPFLTLVAAFNAASNDDTIRILDSEDYFEDIGAGYLLWTKRVHLEGAFGQRPRVGGISGVFSLRVNSGGANSRFSNLRIASHAANTTAMVQLFARADFIDVTFDNVAEVNEPLLLGGVGADSRLIRCDVETYGVANQGFQFRGKVEIQDCDFRLTLDSLFGVRFQDGHDGTTIDGLKVSADVAMTFATSTDPSVINLRNLEIEASNSALRINGNTTSTISDVKSTSAGIGVAVTSGSNNVSVWTRINSVADNVPVSICSDFVPAGERNNTGYLTNSHGVATGPAGHAGLLGVGSLDCVVADNTFVGSVFGFVLKGISNRVEGNEVYGGLTDSLLVKGATACHVSGNKFHTGISASILAIELDENGVVDSDNNVIRFNEFHSTSSGQLFEVAATGQSGNVVNNNVYHHQGSWGAIEGTAVASLQEARDAWGNGNDVYSTDGSEVIQTLTAAEANSTALATPDDFKADTTALAAAATAALNDAISNLGSGETIEAYDDTALIQLVTDLKNELGKVKKLGEPITHTRVGGGSDTTTETRASNG